MCRTRFGSRSTTKLAVAGAVQYVERNTHNVMCKGEMLNLFATMIIAFLCQWVKLPVPPTGSEKIRQGTV